METRRKSKTMEVFQATRRQLRSALKKGIEEGVEEMKRLVPKDTGDLDSTIEGSWDGKNGNITVGNKTGKSGNFVDYQNAVECGAVHQNENGIYYTPAQPFFRPGIDRARRTIRQNLKVVKK